MFSDYSDRSFSEGCTCNSAIGRCIAMSGRKGSSGHQNLIEAASMRLLNQFIGDKWLRISLVREQPLDVKSEVDVRGERWGSTNVANAAYRLYTDICAGVVYDKEAAFNARVDPLPKEILDELDRLKAEGNMTAYCEQIRKQFGSVIYLIECEINPRSNLLRDGTRLTAYQLIKQQNKNIVLILAVFEGTKVDNPGIFDEIWEFERK